MKLVPVTAIVLVAYFSVSLVVIHMRLEEEESSSTPFVISQQVDDISVQQTHEKEVQRLHFPKYGTLEFAKQCPWVQQEEETQDCTFLARPKPNDHEGVSMWTARIASTFLLAQQASCRVLLDYGPDVDVSQVFQSPARSLNWTVPSKDFSCTKTCFLTNFISDHDIQMKLKRRIRLGRRFVSVPWYRSVYAPNPALGINKTEYQELLQLLPGFQFETGMACAMNALFQLSSTASRYEPHLFTTLLPKLRDPNNLVLALYIRTGQVDYPNLSGMEGRHRQQAQPYVDCAIQLEQEHAEKADHIVWMLITDTPYLKQWIPETYIANNTTSREILTTSSRGKHTRIQDHPSTQDFVEGMLDWYLIGESDLVIMGGYTFGMTASLRTARPVYQALTCSPLSMFRTST